MHSSSRQITTKLTVKYVLTLALLAGLALANYLILATQMAASRSVDQIVTLSSQQRALLLQSAVLARQLTSPERRKDGSQIRQELIATVGPMERTHHQLIRKDSIVPPPASVEAVYYDSPWLLDTEMRNFIAQVRSLAEADDRDLGPDNPQVSYLWDSATDGTLPQGLDAVVSAYRREAADKSRLLQQLAAWSLGSTAAVLGISGLFIFRPMVRRVSDDMDALNDLNTTLETRVAERSALAESRAEALASSERAFREQSRILQSILDNMGDGVIVAEMDGPFHLFNPRAREIFHIGPRDDVPDIWQPRWMTRRRLQFLKSDGVTPYPPEQLPYVRALGGEPVDRQEVLIASEASSPHACVSITARPLVDGGTDVKGVVAVVRDITEMKEAEQRLRNSEALYHSLVDNLPLYVVRKDLDGRFTFVNHLMCQLMKKPLDEIVGRNDFDFYPHALAEKYRRDDRRVAESGKLMQDIEAHHTPDGRVLHVEILKAPLRDADEQIIGTQTVFIDVTARVEAERRLLQSERLAAIGQMVAGVAHESRNALQQIQACCGLLGWKIENDLEARELIQDIEKAQARLHRLFDDLKDYAAPVKLEKARRDVRVIIDDVWTALEHLHENRDATLEVAPTDVDTRCDIDTFGLEQVFRNLFENALAACDDPTVIEVGFGETLCENENALEISVHDNGPGMNDEQRAKVFEPFFTTKSRGTGLGMAIAQRIVEAHGGRIGVMPPGEVGTEFRITIPRGRP